MAVLLKMDARRPRGRAGGTGAAAGVGGKLDPEGKAEPGGGFEPEGKAEPGR